MPVYIELRDELWHELAQQKSNPEDLEKSVGAAHSLALLHLANTIVSVLLEGKPPPKTKRPLELWRCEVCSNFIEDAAREVQGRGGLKLTLDFIRCSLEAAVDKASTFRS